MRKARGLLFVGKNVKILARKHIELGGGSTIEDGCFINGLCKGGIRIGNNFSLGRNSIIECTGVIRELGESLEIGDDVGIAANAFISVRGSVRIGDSTIFGPNVSLFSENHNSSDLKVPIYLQGATRLGITIGEDCWLGANVTVLDGVTIGDKCIVAAGAVVDRDIPPYSVAGGVPAKILKSRKDVCDM
jgi:acetyltransferase-like isoleucine patch superfamily enzyme